MTAGIPRVRAPSATPWAWFPAEAQITPDADVIDRLKVFTFEQDAVVQTARQPRGGLQRCFNGDVVYLGFEDAIYVVFLHGLFH